MNKVPITKHLVSRRFWRPLAQSVSCIQRPLLCSYDWLFTHGKLEAAILGLLTPLLRLHLWLCRKAGQARSPRLFCHSSLAYDLAALCVESLARLTKWQASARQRMNSEIDPRLRSDDKPANRNRENTGGDHEQN